MSINITDLKERDTYAGEQLQLLINSVKRMAFKNKEGCYYSLSLQDSSGTVEGKIWNVYPEIEDLPEKCVEQEGVYVYVSCSVESYNGKPQLNISKVIEIPEDQVTYEKFIPICQKDRNDLFLQVRNLISKVKDSEYRQFIISVFSDEELRKGFIDGIGGLKHHHNYRGGLLEHSLQVTIGALSFCNNEYLFPELNQDLLIVGGLIHDIGKTREYLYNKNFSMNPNEVEHRYSGVGIVDQVILKNNLTISQEKVWNIKHIIISHHGHWGDQNIKCLTPEATVIQHCDEISAHVNEYLKDNDMLYKTQR